MEHMPRNKNKRRGTKFNKVEVLLVIDKYLLQQYKSNPKGLPEDVQRVLKRLLNE